MNGMKGPGALRVFDHHVACVQKGLGHSSLAGPGRACSEPSWGVDRSLWWNLDLPTWVLQARIRIPKGTVFSRRSTGRPVHARENLQLANSHPDSFLCAQESVSRCECRGWPRFILFTRNVALVDARILLHLVMTHCC